MADEETIATIKTAYVNIAKGKEHITQEQLQELIYVIGCKPLLEEPYYKEIISAVDPNNANKITFDAFMSKLTDMMTFKYGEEEIKEAVAVFDDEGKGKVNKAEVLRALTTYSSLPKEQIQAILDMKKGGELMDADELLKKLLGK